jgi:hypothetical protein
MKIAWAFDLPPLKGMKPDGDVETADFKANAVNTIDTVIAAISDDPDDRGVQQVKTYAGALIEHVSKQPDVEQSLHAHGQITENFYLVLKDLQNRPYCRLADGSFIAQLNAVLQASVRGWLSLKRSNGSAWMPAEYQIGFYAVAHVAALEVERLIMQWGGAI